MRRRSGTISLAVWRGAVGFTIGISHEFGTPPNPLVYSEKYIYSPADIVVVRLIGGETTSKVSKPFTYERATKNTYLFREDGDKADHIIGAQYVKKSVFNGNGAPEHITITVEW